MSRLPTKTASKGKPTNTTSQKDKKPVPTGREKPKDRPAMREPMSAAKPARAAAKPRSKVPARSQLDDICYVLAFIVIEHGKAMLETVAVTRYKSASDEELMKKVYKTADELAEENGIPISAIRVLKTTSVGNLTREVQYGITTPPGPGSKPPRLPKVVEPKIGSVERAV